MPMGCAVIWVCSVAYWLLNGVIKAIYGSSMWLGLIKFENVVFVKQGMNLWI